MKKTFVLVLLAVIFASLGATAQTRRIWAEMVYIDHNSPVVFVQNTTTQGGDWSGFNFKENCLRDEEGNEIKFMNMLPALEYMEYLGWTVPDKEEQIYRNIASTLRGRSPFLLYKEVTEDEWLQWIEEGKRKKKK